MNMLGWIVLIAVALYAYSYYDPIGFDIQKQKLLDFGKGNIIGNINETEDESVVPIKTNWGQPYTRSAFPCETDADCRLSFPDAPSTIQCEIEAGECIS